MHNNNHIYNYSGFLLIDLVISIGIFSFFCLSIASMNWQIKKLEKETSLYREAINLANNIIEEIYVTKNCSSTITKKGEFTIKIVPNEAINGLKAVESSEIRQSNSAVAEAMADRPARVYPELKRRAKASSYVKTTADMTAGFPVLSSVEGSAMYLRDKSLGIMATENKNQKNSLKIFQPINVQIQWQGDKFNNINIFAGIIV